MGNRRAFVSNVLRTLMIPGFYAILPEQAFASPTTEFDELEKISKLIAGKEPLKWVFAGDSITQGAKHTFGARSYPEIFAERMRWEMKRVRDLVVNSAISGNTSSDILNDYQWRISQFSPAVVFVMIGTNDASEKKNISVAQFEQNLKELIRRIRSEKAVPVLQTPNITIADKAIGRERLPEYVDATRKVAEANKTILVDHWHYWKQKASSSPEMVYQKWLNDELHPNGRGHDEMAKLLFKKLNMFDANAFTCQDHWPNG